MDINSTPPIGSCRPLTVEELKEKLASAIDLVNKAQEELAALLKAILDGGIERNPIIHDTAFFDNGKEMVDPTTGERWE